ncbi:MAG: hypothetical protein IJ127_01660 [Afipia sp.]|nr:hypothetical protein [Afipia sp.]
MLEQDIGVGRELALGARGNVREVGQEGDRPVDLSEDGVRERRHARHIHSVAIGAKLTIGGINVGVRIDGSNGAVQRPLNQAATDPVLRVALPGIEDMVRHSGSDSRRYGGRPR